MGNETSQPHIPQQVNSYARACLTALSARLEEPLPTPWPEGIQVDAFLDLVANKMVALEEIRRPSWREAVDECRLLTSPAYHLLRDWHSLEPLPYLGQRLAYIADDPNLAFV